MGANKGPNIERDGLVFGYDTGRNPSSNFDHKVDKRRFYKGQPATNLFTVLGSSSSTDQNVTFSVNGTGTFKRVATGTQIGDYKVKSEDVVYSYDLGTNGCHYHGNDYSSVSSGTKVSFSIEYFLTGDVVIVNNYLGNFEQLSGVGGSWGSVSSELEKWHRVTLTRTATATGNLRMLMYPGGCSSGRLSAQGKIYYKNPTVTLTDTHVPFVSGSRSSTTSLLDLIESKTIDIADVSFDSFGLPEFDGTDDQIIIDGVGISDYSQAFSYECVFKAEGTWANSYISNIVGNAGSYAGFYGLGKSGTNTIQFVIRDANYSAISGTVSNVATFHHLVGVWDQSNSQMRLYIDGELASSASSITKTGAPDTTNLYIGGRRAFGGDNGSYYDGVIPVVKYYNTALTTDQVKQNFNSYKNRFNI